MHVQTENKGITDKWAFGTLATLQQQTKLLVAILVYGHVHIFWSYLEAKKKKNGFFDDFSLIVFALKFVRTDWPYEPF